MSSNPAADPAPRPWSIAGRLTVWYAAAAFALVLVATGYLYWALARNLDREDDQFLADKVRAVRRVLADRPGDRSALEQEVATGRAGRFFVRVAPDRDGRDTVETPGMAQLLPWDVFPRVGAAPGEQTGEYRAADGRAFRLRAYAGTDPPHMI